MELATIQAGWDRAAREDAMWNILTHADRRDGGWTPEEFFATGKTEIDAAMERLEELGLPDSGRLALDFGCGIGRLTVALTRYYTKVIGVDVSPEMIARAKDHKRVRYHAEDSLDLLRAGCCDLVYSMIVLQHMPQNLQQGYVTEFFRVLKPGGVAMFAIPDGPDGGHVGWHLSMYGVPRATVEEWITEAGGQLVDVENLGQDGDWRNYRYTACA